VSADNNNDFSLNIGGCYLLIGAPLACATASEEQSECETAACDATCATNGNEYAPCVTAADKTVCASYVAAVSASCPSMITNSLDCGGSASDFEEAFQAVAATFCE
jgi:hypothetical protein